MIDIKFHITYTEHVLDQVNKCMDPFFAHDFIYDRMQTFIHEAPQYVI